MINATFEAARLRTLLQKQDRYATLRYRCASASEADEIEQQLTPDERARVVFSWGRTGGVLGWLQLRPAPGKVEAYRPWPVL